MSAYFAPRTTFRTSPSLCFIHPRVAGGPAGLCLAPRAGFAAAARLLPSVVGSRSPSCRHGGPQPPGTPSSKGPPVPSGCKPRQRAPTAFPGLGGPIHTVPPTADCSNLSCAVIPEKTLHHGNERSVTKNKQVFSHKADKSRSCFGRLRCPLL